MVLVNVINFGKIYHLVSSGELNHVQEIVTHNFILEVKFDDICMKFWPILNPWSFHG